MKKIQLLVLFILVNCLSAISQESGWENKGDYLEQTLKVGSISFLQYSKDGKHFFTFGADNVFRKWESESGMLVDSYELPKTCTNLSISFDETKISVSYLEYYVKVFDFIKRKEITTIEPHNYITVPDNGYLGHIEYLTSTLYQDSSILVGISHTNVLSVGRDSEETGTLVLCNFYTGKLIKEVMSGFGISDINFLDRHLFICSGSHYSEEKWGPGDYRHEASYYLFLKKLNSNFHLSLLHTGGSTDNEIIHISKYFIANHPFDDITTEKIIGFTSNNEMYFWGDDNYHLINQIPISKYGFKNVPFDMTFSNDGNYCITNIMTNDNKNMFVFIDFQTGFVVDSSLFNLNYYDCLIRTTPDNRGLLCGGKDGTIRIFLPKILSKSVVAIFKSDTNKVLVNEPLKFQNYSHGLIRDYFWSFGDGKESTEKNPMHKYAKPGNYLVAMVASDGNNHDLFTQKDTIYVRNEIIPDFSASIDSGFVPLEVKFQDESKGGILKWNWDFGDGTKSTERNPTHIYEKEGNFKVTLALSDTIFNYSKVYEKQIKVKRSPILKPEIGFEVDLGVDSLKWENSSGIECLDGGYAICSQTARLIDSAWYGPDQDDFEYYYEYFTIVMRLNEFADTIWTKELTPFNKIQQTSDSCFILGKSNGKDIVVIKLDKNGNELWQKSYGTGFNDEFGNLQSTPDGGFIITGKANVLDNLQPEAKSLVIKIDKENKENFKLRYIGIGGRMKPTTDRNYIMCNLSQNSKSIFVSKIDFLGNNKWHREFTNSPKTFQCHDIIEYQNGFIVVGFKERGFVLYLDSLGNKVWEYDSPDSNSKFYCVAPYGENIAVSGSLQDTIGLRIFDKDGNLLERYNFKGRKGSVNSMVPTKDYGLFLVGTIKPPYTNTKVFALKINAETNNVKYLNDTQSSQLYPNPNSGSGIIKFTNEEAGLIEIKLFSITGTELKTITDSWFLEGEHEILCNFEDLSNGIYYYIIKQNGQLLNSNKLIIMR